MMTQDGRIALKVGVLLAGIHLAFSLLIWLALCRGESGEGWLYVAFLHLPSISLGLWLFPHLPDLLASLPAPLLYCGFGTLLWFAFGWAMTRIVTLYS
jgi:hypothetical protein